MYDNYNIKYEKSLIDLKRKKFRTFEIGETFKIEKIEKYSEPEAPTQLRRTE